MTFQPGANVYTQGFGSRPENVEVPHIDVRAPTTGDILYPVGKLWIYQGVASYVLIGLSSSNGVTSATWSLATVAAGDLVTLTGDSGTATPSSGNIQIAGTSNQISTAASGSTVTLSLPSAITTPGSLTTTTSLAATTTMTAGTGITSTTGNIVATAGAVSAGTTVTGGTGVVATTGNVTATAGAVSAGTTVTAGTGITSTTGNIVATAGAVNAGTSMTATAGDITATLGNVIINGAANQLRIHGGAVTDFVGQATLTNGTVTVANTNIAATDRVIVTRSAKNGSTAYGTPLITITASTNFVLTACKSDTTTETGDASTFDYFIVRQV